MSNDIFVWIEQTQGQADSIAWEALGAARTIARETGGQVVAAVLGHQIEPLAAQAIRHGADSACIVTDVIIMDFQIAGNLTGENLLLRSRRWLC